MNIVIIGAGDIGRYLALVLSKEQHHVIVVDQQANILEELVSQIDIVTRVASGTEWQLLDDLLELLPDALIALTNDDETNLVSCSIAKHLGYPLTIARVKDNRFLNRTRLDFAHIFNVDYFLCPEMFVAFNILKYIESRGAFTVEHFAHGALEMRTLEIPDSWSKGHKSLSQLKLPERMIVGLIHRKNEEYSNREKADKVIIPHGNDQILPRDEITIIGETDAIKEINHFFGIVTEKIRSCFIIGGSQTGLHLAKLLETRKIAVRLLEKDALICTRLAEQLPNCTVLHHDGTDKEFLLSEKIDKADIVVACTHEDSVNILCAMLAKEAGCKNVMIVLSNPSYRPLVDQLGIKHVVSPRIEAASRILSYMVSGPVNSLVSLYENQAEIIEINVSPQSSLVGIPLSDIGPLFPTDFLIAMIQNRGRIMIASGETIISPGDTVIVVTDPRHIQELERIF